MRGLVRERDDDEREGIWFIMEERNEVLCYREERRDLLYDGQRNLNMV